MIPYVEQDGQWYTQNPDGTAFLGHPMRNAHVLLDLMGRPRSLRRVIDCGGWIGQWSLMHRHAEQIEAFEPNPDVQPLFQHNTRAHPQIHLHPVALSNQPGHTSLRYESHSGTCHMWASGHADQIEVRTLDSYHFDSVDIIKIDVEGMEVPLLQGAEHTIRANRPWIMIESNETAQRYGRIKSETLHLLHSWGMTRVYKRWPDQIFRFTS
jgi:FkbM family methyltransferase